MSAPTKLFLRLNGIDNRYKVVDADGYCFGDGASPESAIAHSRMVSNAPIYDEYDYLVDTVEDC